MKDNKRLEEIVKKKFDNTMKYFDDYNVNIYNAKIYSLTKDFEKNYERRDILDEAIFTKPQKPKTPLQKLAERLNKLRKKDEQKQIQEG